MIFTLASLDDRGVHQPHGLRVCWWLRCRCFPCWGLGVPTPGPRRGAGREQLDPVTFIPIHDMAGL
eukprot:8029731-Alexandrium_andersonii.AAC.1